MYITSYARVSGEGVRTSAGLLVNKTSSLKSDGYVTMIRDDLYPFMNSRFPNKG